MKTITMYELLGLVKDGKAPKRIRIRSASGVYDKEFYFDGDIYMYKDEYEEYAMTDDISIEMLLNDEVEILEEEKETKPLTKKDIEAIGYACGEMRKCFTNGWTKSLENKPLEEEKKIPEKIKIEQDSSSATCYLRNENGTKCYLTRHSTMIAETLNQVIDYLNNKGDE